MSSQTYDLQRSESRLSEKSIHAGSTGTARGDLAIEVTTQENVQFMDQPLRGKIELSGLAAPIENVAISLRGVVKTCVAGNAAWARGFGGDSNVMARFTEKEVTHSQRVVLMVDSEAGVYVTSVYTTCDTVVSLSTTYSSFCVFVSGIGEFAAEHDLPSGAGLC
jgi:hypothetical protein